MQVGDDQLALLGPIERTEAVGVEGYGGDRQRGIALRPPSPTLPRKGGGSTPSMRLVVQLIASFTNSASASASSTSDASP
jgi:hypothetical protein